MRLLAAIVVFFLTLSTAQSERNDTNTGRTWESIRLETPDALEGKDQNLLRWALSHADPDSLNNKAAATKSAAQSALDLAEQRTQILKFLQDTQQQQQQQQDGNNNSHSEIDLMKHALLVLHKHDNNNDNNYSYFSKVEQQQQLAAMSALKLLVEQLDNANDLPVLGGLPPLMKYINKGKKAARLAAAAARVIAAAASNNVSFQDKLIKQHPEVIVSLLELITPSKRSGGEGGEGGGRQRQQQQQQQEEEEDLVRAGLLATASIIRNHAVARREFYQHQGISLLKNILLHSMHRSSSTSATTTTTTISSKSKSIAATRKAVLALLADIFTLDDPHLILGMTTSKGELGTLGIVILSLLDQHVDDEDDAVALEREKTLLALRALIDVDSEYIKDVLRAAGGGKVLKTVQSRLEHVARHHERSKRRRRVIIWKTYDDEEDEDDGEEESGGLFTELARLARELGTHLSGNGSGGGHHSEL
jgi:hypothetical protein